MGQHGVARALGGSERQGAAEEASIDLRREADLVSLTAEAVEDFTKQATQNSDEFLPRLPVCRQASKHMDSVSVVSDDEIAGLSTASTASEILVA